MKIFNTKTSKTNRQILRRESTPQEQKLWKLLKQRNLGCKFRRQHGIGPYIVDFSCREKNLIIEIDGSQHIQNQDYDTKRDAYLKSLNFTILRFWNTDIDTNIEGVMLKIGEYL